MGTKALVDEIQAGRLSGDLKPLFQQLIWGEREERNGGENAKSKKGKEKARRRQGEGKEGEADARQYSTHQKNTITSEMSTMRREKATCIVVCVAV